MLVIPQLPVFLISRTALVSLPCLCPPAFESCFSCQSSLFVSCFSCQSSLLVSSLLVILNLLVFLLSVLLQLSVILVNALLVSHASVVRVFLINVLLFFRVLLQLSESSLSVCSFLEFCFSCQSPASVVSLLCQCHVCWVHVSISHVFLNFQWPVSVISLPDPCLLELSILSVACQSFVTTHSVACEKRYHCEPMTQRHE